MDIAVRATPVTNGGRFASWAMVALLAVAGVGFRLWFLASPLGLVDGDEAVVGLMARRALDGSFEAFFWGQEYGGSQEALLVAALLALGVPGRWAMELVPVGLHAGAALLVWRIGLRTLARPGAAAFAAGLCWAGSPALLWWSTKERGFYGFTLVCGLAALLLLLRLSFCEDQVPEKGSRSSQNQWVAAGLGLMLGLGWWASPQILHFAVPGIVWLAWTGRRRLGEVARTLAVAAPAAVLGALPWLWANAGTGFASLEPAAGRTTFGDPLPVFFEYGLPMVLGLRAPITLAWELPAADLLYAGVVVGLTLVVIAGPRRLGLVRLAVATFPAVFALLPTTYYYGEPRYLDFLWPLLALLAGAALVHLPVVGRAVAVAAILAVTANGVAGMTQLEGPPGEPFEDVSPEPVGPLVAALDDLGADRVYADYWVAYRLTWETGGRIVASPLTDVRDHVLDGAVRMAPAPALVTAVRCEHRLQAALDAVDVAYDEQVVAGVWQIVVPARPVDPSSLGPLC